MRLLIAEDDKALGQFLSRGLEADGHRVHLAYDGGAAVEAFRQELPDLTILDLNMPVKDGEQVLQEVRILDANLPVLVLTARQEVDTRVRCLDRGADDLMTKPFSLHELRACCRALLRRKRETRLAAHGVSAQPAAASAVPAAAAQTKAARHTAGIVGVPSVSPAAQRVGHSLSGRMHERPAKGSAIPMQ